MAAEKINDRNRYARALLALEQLLNDSTQNNKLALAARGVRGGGGSLRRRIESLLQPSISLTRFRGRLTVTVVVAIAAVTVSMKSFAERNGETTQPTTISSRKHVSVIQAPYSTEAGEYYISGVPHAGRFELSSASPNTLKTALISSGFTDILDCQATIIRLDEATNQPSYAQVDVTKLFDMDIPDHSLQRNDVIVVEKLLKTKEASTQPATTSAEAESQPFTFHVYGVPRTGAYVSTVHQSLRAVLISAGAPAEDFTYGVAVQRKDAQGKIVETTRAFVDLFHRGAADEHVQADDVLRVFQYDVSKKPSTNAATNPAANN